MDQARADDLIHQIGSLIINDERYASRDWNGIAVVGIVGDGVTQISGYSYDDHGNSEAGGPRNRALHGLLKDLREAMAEPGKEPWKTCLIQIKKPDLKFTFDFEYQDALRWKVTPRNIDTLVPAMRP